MNKLISSVRNLKKSSKPAEVSRSEYSLVSCNDLTAGAVQLWMGLPEEVKYDPALAPFRQFYEKEHGEELIERKCQGLPSVNSAPHLNNNYDALTTTQLNNYDKETTNDALEDKTETNMVNHLKESVIIKKRMVQRAKYLSKMTVQIACWIFFTLAFLMYDEKEVITRMSSVAPFEITGLTIELGTHLDLTSFVVEVTYQIIDYVISNKSGSFSVLLELSGPFLSETAEMGFDSSRTSNMEVWVERQDGNESVVQISDPWKILLQDEVNLNFLEGEPRSKILKLDPHSSENTTLVLRMRTTSNHTTPFSMSYTLSPLDLTTGVIYATALLLGLYILIIFEVINRTMCGVLVASTALATLAVVGERPPLQQLVAWLDVDTLILLFSMMVLVAVMAETGVFDFVAVFTFEVTKGKLWPLIGLLCTFTTLISLFLDNVTTILLMTPVTIRLCEVMELDPINILIIIVIFCNIGGTATAVGDPPNVIIASNKDVIKAGINFANFTLHMSLGILLVCIQTYIQIRFIYRDANKLRSHERRDIQDLRRQIAIWRRAADSLPHISQDEQVVRERLEKKIKKLTAQLNALIKESSKRACPKENFETTLAVMKEKYKIKDKALLIKGAVAITFVVIIFFLHAIPELNRVSLGWTALLGAILLLTLADRADLEPILHRVEWSTLLFFAALFVLMEALSKLGLIAFIGGVTESLILSVDESARLAVAILLILWVSGIASAFIDNVPLTTMMVRVVTSLGSNPALNLPMQPLIWALSFGACLGGNGTLIGASSNVVCAGVCSQHGYKFSFMRFTAIGLPLMLGHLVVASAYLLLCHCALAWH